MAKRRTAASHPNELTTRAVAVGYEIIGHVGTFPKTKTWFFGKIIRHEGKDHIAWDAKPYPNDTAAEQALFKRWLHLRDLDTEARANAKMQAKVDAALASARAAKEAAAQTVKSLRTEVAKSLDRDELIAALLAVDFDHSMESWAVEYCKFDKPQALQIAKEAGVTAEDIDAEIEYRLAKVDTFEALAIGLTWGTVSSVDAKHVLAQEAGIFGPWDAPRLL